MATNVPEDAKNSLTEESILNNLYIAIFFNNELMIMKIPERRPEQEYYIECK